MLVSNVKCCCVLGTYITRMTDVCELERSGRVVLLAEASDAEMSMS
jgi:hypothetical protein